MSSRNFILLIIVLAVITVGVLGFLYFRQPSGAPEGGEGINFVSMFNPFAPSATAPSTGIEIPPADISGFEAPSVAEETVSDLKIISSMPVAGFGLFNKERYKAVAPVSAEENAPGAQPKPEKEISLAVRYVARATGYIYQTFADKIEEKQFSITNIPKVYEVTFGNKGNAVVMRYLKSNGQTIETFVGVLPKEILGAEKDTNEIKGVFLPDNVKSISVSPDQTSAFYLFENGTNMVGTILNFATNKKTEIFNSPFSEWSSSWPNSKTITLTTKPSSSVPGFMYKIDNTGGNFSRILSEINGLTTKTSPDGRKILYGDNALSLKVYNLDSKSTQTIGLKTLPEKCVWAKNSEAIYCSTPKFILPGSYPDAWYQGEVSFSDQIWKADINTGSTSMVADPANIGKGDVDGIKLALDDGENYLFFVNKKDSLLWELSLK